MEKKISGYFVVCSNGFARGFLLDEAMPTPESSTIPSLEKCCRLRNSLCSCGGTHSIVRVVQTGTGKEVI